MKQANPVALLPILVFILFYLGLGIIFEYVMKIPMGFYNIPIVVAFMLAIFVACVQTRSMSMKEKLEIMGQGVGDRNIITMILIFMAAGIFVGVVGRSSANSVAYFILSIIPVEFSAAALFIIACFVSLSMGTSCGTITVLTPIAVSIAAATHFSLPLCLGSVMGGAMFGDNLSFISDTTIVACNGQGCEMRDKFRANFHIALPAALVTIVIIQLLASGQNITPLELKDYNLVQLIPYVLVLAGGIIGIDVFAVLTIGIVSGIIVMLGTSDVKWTEMLAHMGSGASGMFETSMVAILVAAMGGLIRENGGFAALLAWARRVFKGYKNGQVGVGLLVTAIDIATANNTVAIVMANPIAREMADEYGISPKKTASILDIFSCVTQGIIPYGAQMLILLAATHEMGYTLSAFQVIPYSIYQFMLLLCCLVFIYLVKEKKEK